ncbi:N-acetylglucosamine-6-phosphate deacetylase [Paenibacillus sp.]|uniref:N-acetylglucosamine-6-phosphate deacetylase n=1 Tax=Paenibacillus sp. TaxID=58172 RepID=UPI00281174BE|nr:N-acetylglucosamine-6-phosphate deacetylase [Paenibacillus sp.]
MKKIVVNGMLYTNHGIFDSGTLLIGEEGRIEAVGGPEIAEGREEASIVDVQGKIVIPGFVDVHVHGGAGYHTMKGSYEDLNGMSRFHAAHGTTSFLATTNTDSKEAIVRALRNCADSAERGLEGAEMLGIHLEGPYLSAVRAGAQNKSQLCAPNVEELRRFIEVSRGLIRLVTLAPELDGGMEAVETLSKAGIAVSIGHSDATYAQALDAIARGASQTTHHFNGMSPLHHREPGVVGAGLLCKELTTELIADGIHVHPAVVKLLFDVKGPDRVCMITDAVSSAGLPDGDYGDRTMKDGQIWLKDGSSLAGSSLTMIAALRNALRFTGYPLERLLPSFTTVPARQAGVTARKGTLEAGKDADFLVLDENLSLVSTFVKGKEVYNINISLG